MDEEDDVIDEDDWHFERQGQATLEANLSTHSKQTIFLSGPIEKFQHASSAPVVKGETHRVHVYISGFGDLELGLVWCNGGLGPEVTSRSDSADAAGIEVGDVVAALNGVAVDTFADGLLVSDVSERIATSPRPLSVTMLRPGRYPVECAERPGSPSEASFEWDVVFDGPRLGLALDNQNTGQGGADELVVVRVNAPASSHGIRPGDVVLAFQGQRIDLDTHHSDFARRIGDAPRPLSLTFYRPSALCSTHDSTAPSEIPLSILSSLGFPKMAALELVPDFFVTPQLIQSSPFLQQLGVDEQPTANQGADQEPSGRAAHSLTIFSDFNNPFESAIEGLMNLTGFGSDLREEEEVSGPNVETPEESVGILLMSSVATFHRAVRDLQSSFV